MKQAFLLIHFKANYYLRDIFYNTIFSFIFWKISYLLNGEIL